MISLPIPQTIEQEIATSSKPSKSTQATKSSLSSAEKTSYASSPKVSPPASSSMHKPFQSTITCPHSTIVMDALSSLVHETAAPNQRSLDEAESGTDRHSYRAASHVIHSSPSSSLADLKSMSSAHVNARGVHLREVIIADPTACPTTASENVAATAANVAVSMPVPTSTRIDDCNSLIGLWPTNHTDTAVYDIGDNENCKLQTTTKQLTQATRRTLATPVFSRQEKPTDNSQNSCYQSLSSLKTAEGNIHSGLIGATSKSLVSSVLTNTSIGNRLEVSIESGPKSAHSTSVIAQTNYADCITKQPSALSSRFNDPNYPNRLYQIAQKRLRSEETVKTCLSDPLICLLGCACWTSTINSTHISTPQATTRCSLRSSQFDRHFTSELPVIPDIAETTETTYTSPLNLSPLQPDGGAIQSIDFPTSGVSSYLSSTIGVAHTALTMSSSSSSRGSSYLMHYRRPHSSSYLHNSSRGDTDQYHPHSNHHHQYYSSRLNPAQQRQHQSRYYNQDKQTVPQPSCLMAAKTPPVKRRYPPPAQTSRLRSTGNLHHAGAQQPHYYYTLQSDRREGKRFHDPYSSGWYVGVPSSDGGWTSEEKMSADYEQYTNGGGAGFGYDYRYNISSSCRNNKSSISRPFKCSRSGESKATREGRLLPKHTSVLRRGSEGTQDSLKQMLDDRLVVDRRLYLSLPLGSATTVSKRMRRGSEKFPPLDTSRPLQRPLSATLRRTNSPLGGNAATSFMHSRSTEYLGPRRSGLYGTSVADTSMRALRARLAAARSESHIDHLGVDGDHNIDLDFGSLDRDQHRLTTDSLAARQLRRQIEKQHRQLLKSLLNESPLSQSSCATAAYQIPWPAIPSPYQLQPQNLTLTPNQISPVANIPGQLVCQPTSLIHSTVAPPLFTTATSKTPDQYKSELLASNAIGSMANRQHFQSGVYSAQPPTTEWTEKTFDSNAVVESDPYVALNELLNNSNIMHSLISNPDLTAQLVSSLGLDLNTTPNNDQVAIAAMAGAMAATAVANSGMFEEAEEADPVMMETADNVRGITTTNNFDAANILQAINSTFNPATMDGLLSTVGGDGCVDYFSENAITPPLAPTQSSMPVPLDGDNQELTNLLEQLQSVLSTSLPSDTPGLVEPDRNMYRSTNDVVPIGTFENPLITADNEQASFRDQFLGTSAEQTGPSEQVDRWLMPKVSNEDWSFGTGKSHLFLSSYEVFAECVVLLAAVVVVW